MQYWLYAGLARLTSLSQGRGGTEHMRCLRFLFTSDFLLSLAPYLLKEHLDTPTHLLKMVIM